MSLGKTKLQNVSGPPAWTSDNTQTGRQMITVTLRQKAQSQTHMNVIKYVN